MRFSVSVCFVSPGAGRKEAYRSRVELLAGRGAMHLARGGVLAVWSYAQHSPFATALRSVFRDVRVEPVTVINDLIDGEQTDWLFFARD